MAHCDIDLKFENFLNSVDRETSWRKKELSQLRIQAETHGRDQSLINRVGVVMLYAHWEGWVKRVAELYIIFVDKLGLSYSELSESFFAIALKNEMEKLKTSNSSNVNLDFAQFIINNLNQKPKLKNFKIDTESNLSSAVLNKLTLQLGVTMPDEFVTAGPLIDERLLKTRNEIAHGKYKEVGLSTYAELHSAVLSLLDSFTEAVIDAAEDRQYLRCRAI